MRSNDTHVGIIYNLLLFVIRMISVIVQIKRADHLSVEPQAVTYSLSKHESVTSFYRAYLPAHHTCDH